MSVNHSVAHRPKMCEDVMTYVVKKEPRELVPPDWMIPLRPEGITVRMFCDSTVAEEWINGYFAVGPKFR